MISCSIWSKVLFWSNLVFLIISVKFRKVFIPTSPLSSPISRSGKVTIGVFPACGYDVIDNSLAMNQKWRRRLSGNCCVKYGDKIYTGVWQSHPDAPVDTHARALREGALSTASSENRRALPVKLSFNGPWLVKPQRYPDHSQGLSDMFRSNGHLLNWVIVVRDNSHICRC